MKRKLVKGKGIVRKKEPAKKKRKIVIKNKSNNQKGENTIIDNKGAVVTYTGDFLSPEEATAVYDEIMEKSSFKRDILNMYGKPVPMPRQVCIFGEEGFGYHFYGNERKAIPWSPLLLQAKQKLEAMVNHTYTFALITYYKDGNEYIGWHSDRKKKHKTGEGAWDNLTVISSVSLGAVRPFMLKEKENNEVTSIDLGHGSLLLMKGKTQQLYLHTLPKRPKIEGARINITFRCSEYEKEEISDSEEEEESETEMSED